MLQALLSVRSELDQLALKRAFETLVARHAALRTVFPTIDGEPVQFVRTHDNATIQLEDANSWTEDALRARLQAEVAKPFDLAAGPLMRVSIFGRGQHDLLLIVFHHIIVDFWSLELLLRELLTLYNAERRGWQSNLPPPKPSTRTTLTGSRVCYQDLQEPFTGTTGGRNCQESWPRSTCPWTIPGQPYRPTAAQPRLYYQRLADQAPQAVCQSRGRYAVYGAPCDTQGAASSL